MIDINIRKVETTRSQGGAAEWPSSDRILSLDLASQTWQTSPQYLMVFYSLAVFLFTRASWAEQNKALGNPTGCS